MKDKKYELYKQAKAAGVMAMTSYKKRNEGLYDAFKTFEAIDAGRVKIDAPEVTQGTRTAYIRWKMGLSYTVDGEPRTGSVQARIGALTNEQAAVAFHLSEAYEHSGTITRNALEYAEKLDI